MAYSEYLHCSVCDNKTIYDGEVDYNYSEAADILVLCSDCFDTHNLVLQTKDGSEVKPVSRGSDFLK